MNFRIVSIVAAMLLPALAQAQTAAEPLALNAALDYAERARYPQWSQALEAGAVDPVIDARLPTRQSRLGPNGAGPRLTVWASSVAAQPGETVLLFATLTPTAAPGLFAAPALTGARVTAELVGQRLGALGTVAYRDNGTGADALARDGIYTAAVTLPASANLPLGTADSVMVKVTATLPNDELRQAAGGFQLSRPAARLTGRYQDAVRNGNLVIAAEVEALAPGRVHLSGTLADVTGAPFATAQTARVLAAGSQWVELSFYGLAFHDRGVTGPVQLASIALASADEMPNALGPVLTNAHTTQAYALPQFTARLFDDPALLDAARRLRLDALPVATLPRN
jgi:hypothetical protein